MDNTFCNAIFASNLAARERLTLLGMIFRKDNETHQTWISQPNLAALCGAGLNTTIRSLAQLEQWGVIIHVDDRPVTPGSDRTTKVYKIDLQRLEQLARPNITREKGIVPGASTIPARRVTIYTEARDRGDGEIVPSALGRVDLSSSNVGDRQRLTVNSSSNNAQRREERDKNNPNNKDNSDTQTSGLRPEPAREDFSPSRTHPGRDDSSTTQSPAAPPAPEVTGHEALYTESEIDDLVWIFVNNAPGGRFLNWGSQVKAVEFHSLGGPKFPAARAAFLMFWAFRYSNWWTVAKNWDGTMGGFLRAINKVDKQCRDFWKKKHDALAAKFETTASVRKFLTPAVVPDNTEATGMVECRLCEMFVEAATVTDGLCPPCHDEEPIEHLPTAECAGEHHLRVPEEQLDAEGFCWKCQIERRRLIKEEANEGMDQG